MQPQDAQMMGQVAPAGAMGQQVIIVQNKSGGPKVFGIVAIIIGLLGVLSSFGQFGTDTEGFGGTATAMVYVTALMSLASSGLFLYAGVLLFGYKKSGVWFGFGAVGIGVLSTLINVFIVVKETEKIFGEDAAGFVGQLGLIWAGVQAVCCSMIVALPLLMNGADLE